MNWYKMSQEEFSMRDFIINNRQVATVDGIEYMSPSYSPNDPLYEVNIDLVDKYWKEAPGEDGYYLEPGYDDTRRVNFVEWMKKGIPIEVPEIYIDKDGISFSNGRHRFSVMREMGKTKMAMNVEFSDPQYLSLIEARLI